MKPKTKAQKQVSLLFPQLPDNTIEQYMTARQEMFEHHAIRYRGTCTCTECGKRWQDATSDGEVTCPHCGARLTIKAENKYTFNDDGFYQIAMEFHGWQVIRLYYLNRVCRMKQYWCSMDEIGQIWFNSKGDEVWVTAPRNAFSYYHKCPWSRSGDFAIRENRRNAGHTYYYSYDIIDVRSEGAFVQGLIHPLDYCFRYNPDRFMKFDMGDLAYVLLKDRFAETVFKMNEELFTEYVRNMRRFGKKQREALKIMFRHKYMPPKGMFASWLDMVDWLIELGKDIHNPFYVCPGNFSKAHDYWHKVITKKREAEEELRRLEKAKAKNELYVKMRERFYPLDITDGELSIRVLPDVSSFYREWKEMNHCVYTHGYWDMESYPNSLILSARKGDWNNVKNAVETVEVDIKRGTIIQSRGHQNLASEYHDRIVKMVEDSMPLILEYASGKHKKKLAEAV